MVRYADLRDPDLFTEAERDWVSRRLLDLRAQMKSPPGIGIPSRTRHSSLIIGTWNLRDFDNNKYRHGPRRRESLFYIAEIISGFDVCALQEINEDLTPLRKIMELLGPHWDFMATDVTVGSSGNRERMAFVFDKSKVDFMNVAGEVVLPKHALLPDEQQFARTPFLMRFQAGWFHFTLCTVHIYYGSSEKGSDRYQRRVAEIKHIAKEMARRADREDENYILLGDFNIGNKLDATMEALTGAGFQLPPELFPSNLLGNKYYDQIVFRTRKDEVTFINAGAFNFAKSLFLPEHYDHYAPVLPERHRELKENGVPKNRGDDKDYYLSRWRTWQVSDHLPLWVELAIDFSDEHLQHNLPQAAQVEAAPAQLETVTEDDGELTVLVPPASNHADVRRRRKRKAPHKPAKEKVGTARPDGKLTWGLAWKIFWFVATGKADKLRKMREARASQEKDSL
ncbi:MAG: endonuclease/exonuclease/phosphatase family protein [Pseudomonadota bacterium]|nr:endonuclease/exonuclease/phosphatase family protein [Pseudomonadota bacterium]